MRGAWGLLLGLLVASPAAAGTQPSVKHLDEAVKLLKGVQAENTSYRHKDTVVKWSGVDGTALSKAHTDCSGFLNSLIQHTYPAYNAAAFKKWFGTTRPVAHTYHETIVAEKGFKRVTKVADLRPGDIIAVKYPPDSKDTGHTMLISGSPKMRTASAPVVAGTEQWEVPVIDVSRSGHGKADTRRKSDGTFREGLGTGVLRVYSQNAMIMGYSWSTAASSEYHDSKTKHLVVGRLDPKFAP